MLTAVDVNCQIVRQVPTGTAEAGCWPEVHLPIPIGTLGSAARSPPPAASASVRHPTAFRAYGNATGKELRKATLPIAVGGTPMTYVSPKTATHVVVTAGGATARRRRLRAPTRCLRGSYLPLAGEGDRPPKSGWWSGASPSSAVRTAVPPVDRLASTPRLFAGSACGPLPCRDGEGPPVRAERQQQVVRPGAAVVAGVQEHHPARHGRAAHVQVLPGASFILLTVSRGRGVEVPDQRPVGAAWPAGCPGARNTAPGSRWPLQ
jgi:hypothetical protein